MPTSSWAAKILLHNLCAIKTILLVKIKPLFPCMASSVCIHLEFHIWSASSLGQELLFQCLRGDLS